MMTRSRLLGLISVLLVTTCCFAASSEKNVSVAGKWKFSWEARIGTESGTLQLEQADSKLSATYQGHLIAKKGYGTVNGNQVVLNLDFQRTHPFTIIYTGTVDGDKMSGKFEIKDFKDGYDSHGETVRPSNYTWKAVRIPDQTQVSSTQSSATQKDSAQK
jgi:hypothetical protein